MCHELRTKLGISVYVLSATAYGSAGIPDRLIVGSRYTALVEFKGPTTVIEPHQARLNHDIWYRDPGRNFYFRRMPIGNGGIFYAGDDPENRVPVGMAYDYVTFDKALKELVRKWTEKPL